MNNFFQDFLSYSEGVRQLTQATIISYKNDLIIFENWFEELELDIFSLTQSDIRIFIAELADKKMSPTSINRMLSTIRGFYKYAVKFNLTKINPVISIRNLKIVQKLPNFMFSKQAEKFCALPENSGILWKSRDTALFSALYSTGCRVSELSGLDMKNLDSSLTYAIVYGKGKKERKVFFASFARNFLKEYLNDREELLKRHQGEKQIDNTGKIRDAVFLNQQGQPLTTRGIHYIINRYVSISSDVKKLSPHSFRHSFASTLVTRGANIRVVQELLGHSSVSTTQKYTHITAEQLHNLYKVAHPHS